MNPRDNSTQSGQVPLSARNIRRNKPDTESQPGRDVAGRPKAAGNVEQALSCAGGTGALEDASEEAGAAAQQTAEDAAETEETAADGRADRSCPHRRSGAWPTRRRPHRRPPAGRPALAGETTDDVTELVVAGQDTALVAENPTFAAEQPAHETVEQPSVEQSQEAADRRHRDRWSADAGMVLAAPRHRPSANLPLQPFVPSFHVLFSLTPPAPQSRLISIALRTRAWPCASATGPMAEVEGEPT